MSDYTKKSWEKGEVISAEALNNMENGIFNANKTAKEAKEAIPAPSADQAGNALIVNESGTGYKFGKAGEAPNWNAAEGESGYVKNRTHYVESCMVEMPVSVIEDNGDYGITARVGLVVGETYTVKWNDRTYEVTGVDVNALSGGQYPGVGIGNTAALGGPDNGVPFGIVDFGMDVGGGLYGLVVPVNNTYDENFAIYQGGEIIHKLDNKFLDLAWLPVHDKKEIVPATTFENGMPKSVGGYDSIPLGTIFVTVDGVLYETTHIMIGEGAESFSVFGNLYYLDQSMPNTGEPFVGTCYSAHTTFTFADGASHTASIMTAIPNKMPAEFLPEDVTVFHLTSPNGTKYAITVSDDGTLSAAAVTQ